MQFLIKHKIPFSLTLTCLLLLTAQTSFALPPAFQAKYSVDKGSMTLGNLHISLKYSGDKYSYQQFTKSTGLAALLTGIKITEKSDGKISGQNIIPQNYLYNQSRRSKNRIDKVQFIKNRAIGSYKGKSYNFTIPTGTLDRSSMEIALARDLSLNRKQLSYTIVGRGEKTHYNFSRLGNEILKTPAGTFNTIKVRVKRTSKSRETIFWMAKELGYLPVKIRHSEKGSVITSIIKDYKKL